MQRLALVILALILAALTCAPRLGAQETATPPHDTATPVELIVRLYSDADADTPLPTAPSGVRLHLRIQALRQGEPANDLNGQVTMAGLTSAGPDAGPLTLTLVDGKAAAVEVIATGATISANMAGATSRAEVWVMPGWLSILPPLLALVLAIATRQVLPALLGGVWLGATVGAGLDPLEGTLRTLDTVLVGALADADHAKIILFTMMLGGMTAVIARSGGTHGVVAAVAPMATTPRRGLLATWLLGLAVFFDDYANTLVVGPTMRPVTDRLRISREKLAYVVDSTAAPVAALALVSTWIGTELAYIKDGYASLGLDADPYAVFLTALPARFYSILAIMLVAAVILTRRDLGAMARAEQRARSGKGLLAPGAVPAGGGDIEKLEPPADAPRRWANAVLPIAAVVVVTLVGLYTTGRAAVAEIASPSLREIFGNADSYNSLIWASASGAFLAIVLAVGQRILNLSEAMESWLLGAKSMLPAIAILVLAWSLSAVCRDQLLTGPYVAELLTGRLSPGLLPAVTFLACAGISFATGTSWGTMGLMLPLSIGVAGNLLRAAAPEGQAIDAFDPVLLGTIVAVLDGAIFGDHCSPISDTTVLSSLATSSDHMDHVRTQLPYALLGAICALLLGYLPYGMGMPAPLGLGLGLLVLMGVLRLAGKTTTAAATEAA